MTDEQKRYYDAMVAFAVAYTGVAMPKGIYHIRTVRVCGECGGCGISLDTLNKCAACGGKGYPLSDNA